MTRGTTWTTDAPFRETATTLAAREAEGTATAEMEAAGLLALAGTSRRPVICVADVTKDLGRSERDFEKGAQERRDRLVDPRAGDRGRLSARYVGR